ncbi:MAG: lysozyme [Candidatus Liberibacter asiaticus]|nr:lysozyme [Candidatus Liberibacter asiaticus]BAP26825.1 phage-related lysozyme [Candidatus Liberibacter asiaticus str. Ishi-1]KAE9511908.1 Lysozyme RrrD [Candidatus Liberibacter asiaticus]KAE9514057.1 Lysozyme RrrD [Candidatus Liberibacter asiaticus]KAE9515112.1 Lysozyme RrrD [Candidatus Liberibacter asiaticus]KAE9517203.1 Lysozyme RrrD [Candidatus Liberibacter asiaticus]
MNGDDKHNKIPVPNALIKMLKEFEGLRLTAYRDIGGGAWTIGYGHTGSDVTEGMTITEKEAEDFLLKDASKSLNLLLESSPALKSTSENRLVAVADFVFNLGIGNYNKSTFKQRVDAQDWEKAAEECKKWTKAGGKVLPGLVKRRDAEVKLLLES